MYNLRARARAALSGSIRAQGMGVRGSPTFASQVTPTQALEMQEQTEIIPDTEMPVSDLSEVSTTQTNTRKTLKSEETQPPVPPKSLLGILHNS